MVQQISSTGLQIREKCRRRCDGNACGYERPLTASASCGALNSQHGSIMSFAGSSCLSWSRSSIRRPGTATESSHWHSPRSVYPRSRPKTGGNDLPLSFEQLFAESCSRATKRIACERREGSRPGTALRSRKQYRSLKRWWTLADLKIAEQAEDGSSDASSSFGDEPPESSPILHAPSMQSIQMRRKSIEAMLARRRNSNRKTSVPNAMPEEAGPAKEAGTAAKIMLKHVRARGEVFAGSDADLQDPDLIEILTPPDEQEVLMRMGDSSEGFTEKDAERLRKAFVLHRQAFSPEIHTDDLEQILDYLGYLKISEADIHAMVSEITRYSTMEFEEFMSFMTRARAFDQNQVREKFALFDADQSGELSADELEGVLKSLGITPSRTTIAGALAVVDEDGSGSLDFEEFVQLLLIYRKTEGFAESEVLKLHRIFTRFAETKPSTSGRRMLPYDHSNKALIEMFGSQAAQLASRLGSAMPRPPSEGEEGKKPSKKAEGMTFREFLIWARRLREIEVQWYQQEFARADVDKGGFLDEEEIRLVLQRLGYTPLRAVIFDMIEAANPQKRGMLDFDEFVQMMELFRNSNGFMRHEVREFKQSFDMFDTEKVGEVDVIQVGGILRSLGFVTELAEVQVLLKTVDWNGSNSLDFSEFLRLMRMHREQELLRIRDTFDKYADTDVLDDGVVKVTVEPGDVKTMLRLLGFSDNFVTSTTGVFRALLREALDYDAMVLLCDSCRRMNMEKMRKQAGFSDEAVEKFQKLFRALDSDDSGEIAQNELVAFCQDRGLSLQTKKDQLQLLSFIKEARTTALQAGVPSHLCGMEGSAAVTQWVFIHLQRILQTHQDKERASQLRGSGPANFSQAEVDELSVIFSKGLTAERGSPTSDPKATLSINGLWTILSQLGVQLTPIEREEVKVKLFMDCGNQLDLPAQIAEGKAQNLLETSEKEDLLATCKSMTKAMDSCKSAAVVQMFAGSQCFPTLILYVKTSVVFLREFSPRGPFPLALHDSCECCDSIAVARPVLRDVPLKEYLESRGEFDARAPLGHRVLLTDLPFSEMRCIRSDFHVGGLGRVSSNKLEERSYVIAALERVLVDFEHKSLEGWRRLAVTKATSACLQADALKDEMKQAADENRLVADVAGELLPRALATSRVLAKAALRLEAFSSYLLAQAAVDSGITFPEVDQQEVRHQFDDLLMDYYKMVVREHDELAFNIIPSFQASSVKRVVPVNSMSPVYLLVLNLGQTAKVGFTTLWSILRLRSVPLRIFVLGDAAGLENWRATLHDLETSGKMRSLNLIEFEYVDFTTNMNFQLFMSQYPSDCDVNKIGEALLARFICHELLPSHVDRVIAMDLGDVLVLDDIADLWAQFDTFEKHHVFAAAHISALSHVNGGLALYDLSRMRARNWTSLALRAAREGLGRSGDCIHDQSLMNTLHLHSPGEPSPMQTLPCRWMLVPATEWGMFWNSPELVLPEVRERRRYPGMVGAGHFEVYCPDPVDLLSGWSFLLSTGNTRQRLRTMSLLKGNQRLTQCTKEGTAGFVHPRDVHPSRCCRCGERASLVHIPGDMKQWSFVDTLFRYHSPFSDWEEKELQETLTRQLWQKESRFAEQSRHVQGAAGQMVELYGGEVCFRRDFSMCCSARNELRGGQKVLYKTLNMKPLPPPFHLEVETTAKSDAHLLMGQGPLNSLEIVAGAHGGAWSAARWVSEGSFVALTAFDGSPQQDSRDRSGAAKYSVQLEEDGRLLVRHGLSEWGFYLPEKYLSELRQHPVGIYVGVPGDLSATWNLCRKSLAEKASACFDASRALTKSLTCSWLSLQGNCLPEFVLVVVCRLCIARRSSKRARLSLSSRCGFSGGSKSMGILRASVAVCVGLVRCLLLFVLTAAAAVCGCAVMADLNTLCYGNEAHRLASEFLAVVPRQVRSLAIIVLPPLCCWLCVKGLKGSGGSRWTGCGAALAAGMLIGVLAGPLPGPYAFFQDVDVRDEMTHSSVQRPQADAHTMFLRSTQLVEARNHAVLILAGIKLDAPERSESTVHTRMISQKTSGYDVLIQVPRRVSIQSKRVAVLYLIGVLATLSYVIFDFISTEAWHGKLRISSGSVTVWRDPPKVDHAARNHCTNPEQYDTIFDESWQYRPRSCRHLVGSSAFRKQGDWLHFPSYVEETYMWKYSNCTEQNRLAYMNMARPTDVSEHGEISWEEVSNTTCICNLKDSYFAQYPEDEVLVFTHSYFVPTLDGSTTLPLFGLPEWGSVQTILLAVDGSRCVVGGQSSWSEAEAAIGIGAPLRDWIRCAGIDLDTDPLHLTSQTGSPNLARHLRIMGFILDFSLNYLSHGAHREAHKGVVCYITVKAHAAWNSNVEVQKLVLEPGTSTVEHQIYMYGVTPRFRIEGDFRFFSHTPIMTWIISATVLFGLPAVLMRYLVEFMLGVPSQIYRRETCRPFDIYDHLRKTQARMLSSHAAYSVLSSNASLDKASLEKYLQDLYDAQIRDGTLQSKEMERLWRATMTGFDIDESGKISLAEFVAASSMVDDLHLDDIVHFLDADRKDHSNTDYEFDAAVDPPSEHRKDSWEEVMWRMSWIVSHVNSMVASDRSKPPGNGAMPLSGGWVLMQSRSAPGKRFYYNSRTGESSWERPA
ncbi:CMD1 [Symbiodinium sp. KB8]|nr:CMD1 [Symbiodinium sp. KB8]